MTASTTQQLIQRASRGGIWRLSGRAVHAGLLFPEAFGLMGMVSVLLVGLELFSDTGVGLSIVRSPRGPERIFLDIAWTV